MPRSQLLARAKHSGWSSTTRTWKTGGQRAAKRRLRRQRNGIRHPPAPTIGRRDNVCDLHSLIATSESVGNGPPTTTPNLDPVSGATLHFFRPRPPVTAVRHPSRFQKHYHCRVEFAQTANTPGLVSKALVVGVHLPSSCLVTQPSHATGHTRHNLKAGRRERGERGHERPAPSGIRQTNVKGGDLATASNALAACCCSQPCSRGRGYRRVNINPCLAAAPMEQGSKREDKLKSFDRHQSTRKRGQEAQQPKSRLREHVPPLRAY